MSGQSTEVAERVGETWLTYEQASAHCGLDRVTLWRAVKRGDLHAGGAGRAVRFERAELDRWMRAGSAL
jgi:excisionase family DNA binding protein